MLEAMLYTARKDLMLMAKDRAALAILFVMPLFFILVMSLAMVNVYSPGTKASLTLVLVDQDGGPFVRRLARAIEDTKGFNLISQANGQSLSREEGERLLRSGRAQAVVVIPAGLSAALERVVRGQGRSERQLVLITDPAISPQVLTPLRGALTGLASQAALSGLAGSGLGQVFDRLRQGGATIPDDLAQNLQRDGDRLAGGSLALIGFKEELPAGMAVGRRPNSVEQNVPAYTLLGMFFVALQLAANIMEEKRLGTSLRLLASPVPGWAILLGKLIAFVLINLIQVAVMLTVGVAVLPLLGAPPMTLGSHPSALFLVALAVALAANGLGLLLAAFGKTQARTNGLGLLIILGSAMLGGVMVPQFVMPDFMRAMGWISPHSWGLRAFQDVLMRGMGAVDIAGSLTALLAFALAFFLVAAWRFRWE